jgi:G:T-mismatch repair DNA endonuclease (very short patch repair protein)
MDVHTKKQRSYNMSRIRSKDTKPYNYISEKYRKAIEYKL